MLHKYLVLTGNYVYGENEHALYGIDYTNKLVTDNFVSGEQMGLRACKYTQQSTTCYE